MPNLFGQFKFWITFVLLSLVFLIVGYLGWHRQGLIAGFLIASICNYFTLFYPHTNLLREPGNESCSGRDPWLLNSTVEYFCEKLRVRTPEIFISPSATPSIYTLNYDFTHQAIGISQGLLAQFTPAEVEALLALAVVHLKERQVFVRILVERLGLTFLGIGQMTDLWLRNLLKFFHLPLAGKICPFSTLLYPVTWLHLIFAFPNRHWFLCDQMAKSLLARPIVLSEALTKLYHISECELFLPTIGTEHYYLLRKAQLRACRENSLIGQLCIQPKIDVRIKSLVGYFPT